MLVAVILLTITHTPVECCPLSKKRTIIGRHYRKVETNSLDWFSGIREGGRESI